MEGTVTEPFWLCKKFGQEQKYKINEPRDDFACFFFQLTYLLSTLIVTSSYLINLV